MDALERTQKALRDAGYTVYSPGVHPGECKSPYIVVRHAGTYAVVGGGNKVGNTLLEVICYVPLAKHAELAPMARRIQAAMRALVQQVRPTGHVGPDIIEQEYRAHSASIEYQVLKIL